MTDEDALPVPHAENPPASDLLPAEGDETPPPELLRLATQIVEIERAKVEVEAKAIVASDDQDKRIAAFHTRRIELDDAADQRRVKLVGRTMLGVLMAAALPIALLLYMVFWGSVDQREIALAILTTGGVALAGYGAITAMVRGAKAILNRGQ